MIARKSDADTANRARRAQMFHALARSKSVRSHLAAFEQLTGWVLKFVTPTDAAISLKKGNRLQVRVHIVVHKQQVAILIATAPGNVHSSIPRSRLRQCEDLLGILAEHLGNHSQYWLLPAQQGDHPFVAKVRAYVLAHLADTATTRDAARYMGMREESFCRIFKRRMRLTFVDYLTMLRIDRAKDLLCESESRIKEIAFATGFHSISQFDHVFRRWMDLSPTEYQIKIRQQKIKIEQLYLLAKARRPSPRSRA